jgi:catechol 2,3-dioxygenase-like lactoylglutathione lyase family enzyme
MSDTVASGLAIRIHHTMLPVADIDRSLKFYTTLLGMNLRFRRKSEARMTEQAHVGYGDGAVHSSIELTQAIGNRASEPVIPTTGHIGIDVSDIRATAIPKCRRAGHESPQCTSDHCRRWCFGADDRNAQARSL